MLLGTLVDHCQQAYNAVSDDFFTLPWYISMVWRAETELATEGWVIEQTYSTSSVSGTRDLAWPTNCLAIKEIKYDYKILKKVSLREDPVTSSTGTSGDPTCYAIWDNTIILYPTPNTSSDTIQIRVYLAPSQLSTLTDPLNVPAEYQIQLADYILGQMALKDQNYPLSQSYMNKWEQTVERCRRQRRRRLRGDRNAVVKDAYFGTDMSFGGVFDGFSY